LAGGATFSADQYAHAFGCSGKNRRPALRWSGAPSRAKSFAVTVNDIDAPTGSGFWHDVVWDVPGSATSLGPTSPRGAVEGLNDAGQNGYLGPCPPAGDGRHRYVIDVYALDVPTLGAPASTPPAVANFMMHGHIVGKAELTATAKR
jgi:Raf kinase inhibitor-like YbhB/YbcL family protein